MTARVVVVDDEALVCAGARLTLGRADGVEVVAAVDGRAAMSAISRERPDVVLLEVRLRSRDGWALLAEIRSLVDAPAVAVLTASGAVHEVGRALRGGATGFLVKDTDLGGLPALVRSVAAGAVVLSPEASWGVVAHRSPHGTAEARRLESLTCRERQVLARLATGASNAEIGARLHLSRGTVKDHVSAILAKLGVSCRLQAALVADRGRLSDDAMARP